MSDTRWPNFWRKELQCRCGNCYLGADDMDGDTMDRVQWLRTKTGIIMPITSAVRCHTHDDTLGGKRAHTIQEETGSAHSIDVGVSRKDATLLNRIAIKHGLFTGMGWKQHGSNRFMHYDTLWETDDRPRPIDWSY